MTKLLRRLGRHRPDAEALSALLDGVLAAEQARALEAHVAACDACAARLAELRRVRSALTALPDVAPPRSFAVRPAHLEAPARAPAPSPWMRMAPALSAAAVVVFAVLVGFDASRGDGGSDNGGALFAPNAEESEIAADRAAAPPSGAAGDDAAAGTQPAPAAAEGAAGPEATASADGDNAFADHGAAEATASAVAKQALAMRDASPEVEDDSLGDTVIIHEDDGGLDWLLVAEVAAGALALVAGAYAAGTWFQRWLES